MSNLHPLEMVVLVAWVYDVPPDDIRNRMFISAESHSPESRRCYEARAVVAYLCRQHTPAKWREIAELFKRRDSSGKWQRDMCLSIADRLAYDLELFRKVEKAELLIEHLHEARMSMDEQARESALKSARRGIALGGKSGYKSYSRDIEAGE